MSQELKPAETGPSRAMGLRVPTWVYERIVALAAEERRPPHAQAILLLQDALAARTKTKGEPRANKGS
jgi:hypothetical protein